MIVVVVVEFIVAGGALGRGATGVALTKISCSCLTGPDAAVNRKGENNSIQVD